MVRRIYHDASELDWTNPKHIAYTVLSLGMFGLGIAFRWNTVMYVGVIVIDILAINRENLKNKSLSYRRRTIFGILWGILALILSIVMIGISGYGYKDILNEYRTVLYVFNQAGILSAASGIQWQEEILRTILTLTPMFTPAFGLISVVGIIELIRSRDPLLMVVLVRIIGIIPWLRSGVPKFIITSLPGFVLCFAIGFTALCDRINRRWLRLAVNLTLSLLLIGQWVIGIRVAREGTAWGPGFELRSYDYPEAEGTHLDLTLGPGAAFPTFEGPRPLFGHGFGLIRGDWREFVLKNAMERRKASQYAISLGYPLVVTNWSPYYFLNDLYSMGFKTHDPLKKDDEYFIKRRFTNMQGQSITMLFHEVEANSINEFVQNLSDQLGDSNKIIFVGYPKVMLFLFEHFPEAMEPIGSRSAVLDISTLP